MTFSEMTQIAYNAISQRRMNNIPVRMTDSVCIIYSANNRIYTGFSSIEANGGMNMIEKHAELEAVNAMYRYNDLIIKAVSVVNVANLSFVPMCSSCINAMLGMNPNNSAAIVLMPDSAIYLSQAEQFFASQDTANQYSNTMYGQNYPYQPNQPAYTNAQMYQNSLGYPNMPMPNYPAAQQVPLQTAAATPDMSTFTNVQNVVPPVQQQAQPAIKKKSPEEKVEKVEASSVMMTEKSYDGKLLKNKLNRIMDDDDDMELFELNQKSEKKRFKLF